MTDERSAVRSFLESGDEAAFRALYGRHTPRLWAVALRLAAGDEAEAEEIVQETWIRAARGLAGFGWRSALGTWLIGIATNCFRERIRRERRRIEIPLAEAGDRPAAPTPKLDHVDRIDLERAIDRLSDEHRTVLVLHDLQGLSHDEIADIEGIATGSSRSRLSRARRVLRESLREDERREASR